MTSTSPELGIRAERPRWFEVFEHPTFWAGVSIVTMWLAVLFAAVFGPDFVSTTAGGDTTRVPSALVIALFATIATVSVAKRAFAHEPR